MKTNIITSLRWLARTQTVTLSAAAGCALLSFGGVSSAFAGFTVVSLPDSAYQASTTEIAITAPIGTDLTSIGNKTLTVSFSDTREVEGVPNSGWSTWSSAPYSENPDPTVLIAEGYDSTDVADVLTFSTPVTTFGVELEPDQFLDYNITAAFYNGTTMVGSITQTVDGDAGARLFAAEGAAFTSVDLTSTDDFAMAALRYSTAAVPEPSTWAMMFGGAALLVGMAHRRRALR